MMGERWKDPRLETLDRWSLAAATRLAARVPGLGLDVRQFRVLLTTRLVMDGRGGPFGTVGETTRLVKLMLPFVFALLGLLVGLLLWRHDPEPLLWMTSVQLFTGLVLAIPLVQELGTLLDPSDDAILGHHPLALRTRAAVRIAHVALRVAPCAAAAAVGPLAFGMASHPALAVLLILPLATSLTLLSLAGGLVGLHAVALALWGQRAVDRVETWLQVSLGACLMGAGGLAVPLAAAALFFFAATLGEGLQPALFVLPPVQLGGLFALACGSWTTDHVVLGSLALAVPCVLLALATRADSKRRTASSSTATTATTARSDHGGPRWPGGPAAWVAHRLSRTPHERAGMCFALAATSRERVIVRWYWQLTIGSTAMILLSSWRLATALGDAGHWLVLMLWLAMSFYVHVGLSLRLSGSPGASWVFFTVAADDRDAVAAGALRGAWLSLGLPASLMLVVLTPLLLGWRVLPDVLLMLLATAVLAVEQVIGSPVEHLFDQGRMVATKTLSHPPRQPLAGLGRAGFIGWLLAAIAIHAVLHVRWWLVAGAVAALLPLALRAWRRLALVRVAGEHLVAPP